MKCVILQPSYIPWRGYFHQISLADVFVFYDDVQYDKHGWRNRNRIHSHQGPHWLTIPVHGRGAPVQGTPIQQVEIDWSQPWNRKHWMSLQQAYRKAPYFERYAPSLEPFFQRHDTYLADFTIDLTQHLANLLGESRGDNRGMCVPRFIRSSELPASGSKTDRLISILQHLGADHYLSGPSAASYIEDEKFAAAGIRIEYIRYNYPEYPQLYQPFDPQLSILDLLFMTGPEALTYIL